MTPSLPTLEALSMSDAVRALAWRFTPDVQVVSSASVGEGFDVVTTFETPKVVRRTVGTCDGANVRGFEIRFGRPSEAASPWFEVDRDGVIEPEGAVSVDRRVWGTSLHGLLEGDTFRHSLLERVAARRGRSFVPSPLAFADVRRAQHDRLADWLESEIDVDVLVGLAKSGLT